MINTKRKNQNIFPIFFYGMIFSSKLFFAAGETPPKMPQTSRIRSASEDEVVSPLRRPSSLLSGIPIPSGLPKFSRLRSASPSPLPVPESTGDNDKTEDIQDFPEYTSFSFNEGAVFTQDPKIGGGSEEYEVGAIPTYLMDILLGKASLLPTDEAETPEKPTFEKPTFEKTKPFIERILFDKNEDKIKLLESTKSELEKLSKELTNSFAELLKDLSYHNLSSFSKLLNSIEEREELIKALSSFRFICTLNSKSEEQEEMPSEENEAEIATEEEITKFRDECKKKLINSKGIIQEDSTEIDKLFSLSGSLFVAFPRVANVLSTLDLDGKYLLKEFKNSPELANFKFKDLKDLNLKGLEDLNLKDLKDLKDLEDLEEDEIDALITKALIIKILDAFFGEEKTAQESRKILKEMLSFSLLKRKLEEIIARMKNEKVVDKKAEEEAAKKKAEAAKKKAEEAEAKKKAEAAKAEAAKKKAEEEAAKAEAAKAKTKVGQVGQVAASPSNTTNASIKPTKPSTKSWISKATENIPLVSGVVETIEKYILSPITSLFSTFSDLFQSFKKRFFG